MRSLLLSSLAALALTTTLASPASSPVPNDPCTKSFYTAGNSILKICNTDVTKGTAYVIMQIFKQNPSYVQAQCASYCPSTGGSQTTPSTFNPSDQCKAAVQTAIGDVGAKCGTPANEQATAERLFRQTDARFIAAQCAPYCPTAPPTPKTFYCPPRELDDPNSGQCGLILIGSSQFPECRYSGDGSDSGDIDCYYDSSTGQITPYGTGGACCPTQAPSR